MAKGVNKVILIGNLGKDPEVRTLQSGSACNFTIATSESWKDKATGQQQERTEWHRISVFGKLAEICGQYLKKGSKVYIEGSLRTRKWQNKEGVDQYTTEIIADQMQMLDGRGQGGGMDDTGGYGGSSQQPQARTQNTSSANNELQPASYESFDDDIPF